MDMAAISSTISSEESFNVPLWPYVFLLPLTDNIRTIMKLLERSIIDTARPNGMDSNPVVAKDWELFRFCVFEEF